MGSGVSAQRPVVEADRSGTDGNVFSFDDNLHALSSFVTQNICFCGRLFSLFTFYNHNQPLFNSAGFAECSKELRGEVASAGVETEREDHAMMCHAQLQPRLHLQPQLNPPPQQQPRAQPQQGGPGQPHF